MFCKLNKADTELDAFKSQGKHYKNVYWSTCKRDLACGARPRRSIFSQRQDQDLPTFSRDGDV